MGWRPNPFGLPEAEPAWQDNERKRRRTTEQELLQEQSSDDRFNAAGAPGLMGPEYFKDQEQLTWADDANARYNREHGIDTMYGGITGPLGPVPAGVAQQWQAAHDQAVWNARNRMAREALRFGQGAAGLMTSYRAGGGAALLSNQYGNLANLQMQRASMMQPLDLLGDYRRDTLARAGGAGRSESQWGAALQGLGAILSVAVPGVGTIAGAALMAGGGYLGAQGAGKAQAAYARAGVAGQAYGGQGAQAGAFGAALQAAQGIRQMQQPGGQTGTGTGPGGQPRVPGQYGPEVPGLRESEGIPTRQPGQPAPDLVNQADMASAGQQGGQKSMGQRPGQGGQAGAMGMPGPGVVGADGNFTPDAYAANGMATSPHALASQYLLNQRMAQSLDQDPSWAIISMQWDRELSLRTVGAA